MTDSDKTRNAEPEIRNHLRIGGLALENGVLFQSARHWAVAVRTDDGSIQVASGEKALPGPAAALKRLPLLRAVAGLAETAALLPRAQAAGGRLPLPFGSPEAVVSLLVSMAGAMWVKKRAGRTLSPAVAELAITALTVLPSLIVLRRTRALQYHAAEHKSINAYETSGGLDREQTRDARAEHARCGSNVMAPALALMTAGNLLAGRLMRRPGNRTRLSISLVSLSGAIEAVQWAARHPSSPWARALTGMGSGLQRLVTTREPTEEQLAVSLAALKELLRLEGVGPKADGV